MDCTATIAHHLPGRLRLKINTGKRNPELLKRIADAIAAVEGVRYTQFNPLTGSVLVAYERESGLLLHDLSAGMLRLCVPGFKPEGIVRPITRDTKEKSRLRRITAQLLLAVGVAGVLLPIVPGTPFLIAGAAILGPDDPLVRAGAKLIRNARARFSSR